MKKELYEFWFSDKYWRFTSGVRDVVHEGNVYTALTLKRSSIQIASVLKSDLSVSMPLHSDDSDVSEFLDMYKNKAYQTDILFKLIELDPTPLVLYNGYVAKPKIDSSSKQLTIVCSVLEKRDKRNVGSDMLSKSCTNRIYGRECGLNFDDWRVDAEVTAINGTVLTLSTSLPSHFERGLLLLNAIYSYIIAQPAANQISLYRQRLDIEVGDTVQVVPGCDQSLQLCESRFGNGSRCRIFPNIPDKTPIGDKIVK